MRMVWNAPSTLDASSADVSMLREGEGRGGQLDERFDLDEEEGRAPTHKLKPFS